MVVFSYYPTDPRVRREAEALVEAKHLVHVICLKGTNEARREVVDGVNVIRLNLERKRQGKLRYLWEYFAFIVKSFFKVNCLYFREKYDLIHIHNMPDVLIVSGIIPKLFGVKIVLDLHDPTPEVFMTKYKLDYNSTFIIILLKLESICIRLANIVLTPNLAFKKLFISRGCPENKIHIIMNSPQETIFNIESKNPNLINKRLSNAKMNLMFHGTIVERHGLDTALKAIAIVRKLIPKISFHIFGSGDQYVLKFQQMIYDLNLETNVIYYGVVSQEKIAEFILKIDIGIIPNKKTPFTELNFPTRIFEYLSLGKPVVVPKTQGILDYFDEKSIFFFEPDNEESLASVIFQVYFNINLRLKILKNGYDIYTKHCWKSEKNKFIERMISL